MSLLFLCSMKCSIRLSTESFAFLGFYIMVCILSLAIEIPWSSNTRLTVMLSTCIVFDKILVGTMY